MALSESEELELLELEEQEGKAKQAQQQVQSSQKPESSFQELGNLANSDQSLGGKAFDALKIPSQMASRGLHDIANAIPSPEPTGNLPMDVLKGTPRIAANTLAEVAPQFVSRGSMLLGGAANVLKGVAPLAKVVGSGIGNQIDQITGASPGAISGAFNDATLMAAPGKNAISSVYEAAKKGSPIAKQLAGIPLKENYLDTAVKLADQGKLPPESALEARKIVGSEMGRKSTKYTGDYLKQLYDKFDGIAKSNEGIAAGDEGYKRAIKAESLRNLFPQNKYGGASAFKTGIITALENMGAPGKVAGAIMSPAVAGLGATGAGLATRGLAPIATNPGASATVNNLIQQLIAKYQDRRQF